MTISWYILWPIIFLHMVLVIKLTLLPTGGLFISPSLGGSVANANAPRVSIIKLTQSNWTAVRGADPECLFQRSLLLLFIIIIKIITVHGHIINSTTWNEKTSSMGQRTWDARGNKIYYKCNHIYGQLELYKLLNVYVHCTAPFGYIYYSGKIVVHYDDISIFFGNLQITGHTYNIGKFENNAKAGMTLHRVAGQVATYKSEGRIDLIPFICWKAKGLHQVLIFRKLERCFSVGPN